MIKFEVYQLSYGRKSFVDNMFLELQEGWSRL